MKKLALVGLKPCPHCRRAVAYVNTEDGEHSFGIALDATKTRELSRKDQDPVRERFLTDLLIQLLVSSSYVPRQVVLDWSEEDFLTARMELTTEIFSCSPQEAVALVAASGVPLYATERIFHYIHLFHPPDKEGETDLVQLKPKPTLH